MPWRPLYEPSKEETRELLSRMKKKARFLVVERAQQLLQQGRHPSLEARRWRHAETIP